MKNLSRILPALILGTLAWCAAYDLTPDRGYLVQPLQTGVGYNSTGSMDFVVWNVQPNNNFGPVNNKGFAWAASQWRDQLGKRLGTVNTKSTLCQYDFNLMNNGWFTPPPRGGHSCNGTASHITSGWQDTYSITVFPVNAQNLVFPSIHVRVDPIEANAGDLNKTNNEAWISMRFDGNTQRYYPMENLDIPPAVITLASADSIFYGAYSTTNSNGNITLTSAAAASTRSYTLDQGNQKVGFQARRIKFQNSGGGQAKFVIKAGSKVTMETLGQNVYGPKQDLH